VEETLVNRTVFPGSEEAKQMTVTAGLRCTESLTNLDPIGLLTKMLMEQSLTWYSTKRLLIWKQSVTPAGHLYYQLSALVPAISEIECSLLPTPMFTDGKGHYVVTKEYSLKRLEKQIHWVHKATLFYNLNKAWANPRFSLWMMGYPIEFLDLEQPATQLSLKFQ
jgi:hypothetical protein